MRVGGKESRGGIWGKWKRFETHPFELGLHFSEISGRGRERILGLIQIWRHLGLYFVLLMMDNFAYILCGSRENNVRMRHLYGDVCFSSFALLHIISAFLSSMTLDCFCL